MFDDPQETPHRTAWRTGLIERDLFGEAVSPEFQTPKKYVAVARDGYGKEIARTYIRARPATAHQTARYALRLFVKGRFDLLVREATPQELGCVPVAASTEGEPS